MTRLTKTRTVLHRSRAHAFPTFVPEGDPSPRRHLVRIDEAVFEDMGEPDVVTVTIEPGDHLNDV